MIMKLYIKQQMKAKSSKFNKIMKNNSNIIIKILIKFTNKTIAVLVIK